MTLHTRNLRASRALLAVLAVWVSLCLASCRSGWKVQEGGELPSFILPDLDGNMVSLDDFEGKPLIIAIFATWCGPCREELPHLEKIWQNYGDKGLTVIAIDSMEEADAVKPFVEKLKLTMPVLVDSAGVYTRQLGGSGIPRSLLVDKDHKVVYQVIGYSAQLVKEMEKQASALIE